MSLKAKTLAALALVFMFTGGAQAASLSVLSAFIDGNQADAGAGTGSPGLGSATMTYDSDTGEFLWFVAWQDLMGTVTAAHFHGPALADQNAGVEVAIDTSTNPSQGGAILTSAQATDLLAGLWYVNIHTDLFPSGEIRGQVRPLAPIPLPAAGWLLLTALGAAGFVRKRTF